MSTEICGRSAGGQLLSKRNGVAIVVLDATALRVVQRIPTWKRAGEISLE